MSLLDLNNDQFTKEIAKNLSTPVYHKKGFDDIASFPLIKGKQCLYVMDWRVSKITFAKGVEEFLGYKEDELDPQLLFNFCHSEDKTFVMRIIKGVVLHCSKNNMSGNGEYLNMTFRIKKKDGTYIKILRQSSTYQQDKEGRFISSLSLLTDISFISKVNRVEWDIYAKDLDMDLVKNSVFKEFINFFTKRELDVIAAMAKGLNNIQIAQQLYISKHTVSTHRKNIFAKSNCSNAQEVIEFCKNYGIL